MSEADLRAREQALEREILERTRELVELRQGQPREFIPGVTPISYAGRIYDADEVERLVQKNEAPEDFAVADQLAAEPAAAPPTPKLVAKPLEPLEPRNAPRVLPSIVDAFGAILAAEQNALGVRPEWPTPSSQPASPAAGGELVITDDLVHRVARRVLEQLSDQVVRETVASIASDVAERVVREEIERIKASIK